MPKYVYLAIVAGMLLSGIEYWPALDASLTADEYGLFNRASVTESIGTMVFSPTQGVFYRPGQTLLTKVLYEWFGSHVRYYRLVSLVLHWLTSVFLALVLYELLGMAARWSEAREQAACLAGLLFAVFPRTNETVAWIAAMPTVIAAAAMLAAVLCALRADRGDGAQWYMLLGIVLAVSLSMKETAAPLPFINATIFWFTRMKSGARRSVIGRLTDSATRPAVLVSAFVVAAYLVVRFQVVGGLGGYGLGVFGTSAGRVVGTIVSNVLRTPVLSLAAPLALQSLLPSPAIVAVELVSIAVLAVIVVTVCRKFMRPGDIVPMIPGGWSGAAPLLLFFVVLAGVTMLPTLHLTPSLTTNTGGRYLYAPAAWMAMALSIAIMTVRNRNARIAAATVALCLYVLAGWHSAHGFVRAGTVSDRLITDYAAYCRTHPGARPEVLVSVPYVGGYSALGFAGLREAVRFLRLNVTAPNIPMFGVSVADEGDDVSYTRISDSTIEVRADRRFARVDPVIMLEHGSDVHRVVSDNPHVVRITAGSFAAPDHEPVLVVKAGTYQEWR